MKFSVLIPFRDAAAPTRSGGDLATTARYVAARWAAQCPDVEVIMSDDGGDVGDKHFSKMKAINRAARLATGDVFIISDADVVYANHDYANVLRNAGSRDFYIPYRELFYVRQDAIDAVVQQPSLDDVSFPRNCLMATQPAVNFGPIFTLSRRAFEAVHGMNEMLLMVPGDDTYMGMILVVLYGGSNWMRRPEIAYHLESDAPHIPSIMMAKRTLAPDADSIQRNQFERLEFLDTLSRKTPERRVRRAMLRHLCEANWLDRLAAGGERWP